MHRSWTESQEREGERWRAYERQEVREKKGKGDWKGQREKESEQNFVHTQKPCSLQFSQVSDRLFTLVRDLLRIPRVIPSSGERERVVQAGHRNIKIGGNFTPNDSVRWFSQRFMVAFLCSNSANSPLCLSTWLIQFILPHIWIVLAAAAASLYRFFCCSPANRFVLCKHVNLWWIFPALPCVAMLSVSYYLMTASVPAFLSVFNWIFAPCVPQTALCIFLGHQGPGRIQEMWQTSQWKGKVP